MLPTMKPLSALLGLAAVILGIDSKAAREWLAADRASRDAERAKARAAGHVLK